MQTLVFTSLLFAYYFLFYLDTRNSGHKRTAHYNNDGYALLPTAEQTFNGFEWFHICCVRMLYYVYFKQEI